MRSAVLTGFVLVTLAVVALFVFQTPQTDTPTIALQAPAFARVAHAESGLAQETTPSFLNEAGIAAYFKAPDGISFSSEVRALFRSIETDEGDYIIGAMPVTDYDDQHDVHVYMDTSGWVMAYYLKSEPVSKVFDWKHWTGEEGAPLPTKLKRVLDDLAPKIGTPVQPVSYYHFNYPNATHITLIGDMDSGTDSFTFNLPSSFSYYEYSWSAASNCYKGVYLYLNGEQIVDGYGGFSKEGTFTAGQVPANQIHTMEITPDWCSGDEFGSGGLALVYQEQ